MVKYIQDKNRSMEMYNKIFPATNDIVFKRAFGNTKNVNVIKGFFRSILDIPLNDYETLTI